MAPAGLLHGLRRSVTPTVLAAILVLTHHVLVPAVCSHRRAYYYFAEALLSGPGFRAVACNSYDVFEQGACDERRELFLGSDELPPDIARYKGGSTIVLQARVLRVPQD